MLRRSLLVGAANLALTPLVTPRAALARTGRAARVRPGDPAWPSPKAWAALGQQVGGLLRPEPLLAACQAEKESVACRDTLKHLGNPFFIGDQAGGTQVSGWFNAWTPAPSAYAVAARSARDVAAAVSFARHRNLRLVVKGGGHSYQGTSNAPDSLLVWTRSMRQVTLHDAFVPLDCEAQPEAAVSVGAGALWLDVYEAVTTRGGRYAQGGGCTTVGVAGHVQSGGFGSFSKGFGTAAGGLLEAEVVTADGRVRVVNARRDPDLFWALKGGGGGSFGVVTRLTLRTHPLPARFGDVDAVLRAGSDAAFRALVWRFLGFYAEALHNPHWGEQAAIKPNRTLKISMLAQGLDEAQMRAAWAPFQAWVADPINGIEVVEPFDISTGAMRGLWDMAARRKRGSTSVRFDDRPGVTPNRAWWSGDGEQVGAYLHGYDSMWLPERLLSPSRLGELVDALVEGARSEAIALHFNKGLAGAAPEAVTAAGNTASNPAALSAFALAIVANGGLSQYPGVPWKAVDPRLAEANAAKVVGAMTPLRRIVPDPGSYVSESNYFNPRWERAFWGENYPRLLRVKRRYDPEGLFIVHHGVGSEYWSPDGFRPMG